MKANQYGPVNPTFTKCEYPPCQNICRRAPRHLITGKNRHCSNRCAKLAQPRKYGEDIGYYIIAHLDTMNYAEMGKALDIEVNVFTKIREQMRMRGFAIPHKTRKIDNKPKRVRNSIPQPKLLTVKKSIAMIPTKTGKPDKRLGNTKKTGHRKMTDKPIVEGAKVRDIDRVYKSVKRKDGPIKIFFKDKAKTRFTASDKEHYERIIKTYSPLFGEHHVIGLPV